MSEWISVKERPPEPGQEILLWEAGTPYDKDYGHYSVCEYNPNVYQPCLVFATHWMPLPPPPGEEDANGLCG